MAKLELTNEEAILLCNIFGIEQEAWQDEVERLMKEEVFDSWKDLLEAVEYSQEIIRLLKKLGKQLTENERGSTSEAL